MKSASEWESEILRLKTGNVAKVILAIQSDARESALREALHYIKLSLPEKLPKRSRPNTKHRLAEIIASLIPEAGK